MEAKQFRNTDYFVYPDGKIYSKKSNKFLKERINSRGYKWVVLYYNNKPNSHFIHRLVAECFIPNPNNLETVNHIDENKSNNHYSNLEWMDRKENNRYSKNKAVQMIDKDTGKVLKCFPSMMEAERQTHISNADISRVCNGKLKQAGGYLWRKCEAIENQNQS